MIAKVKVLKEKIAFKGMNLKEFAQEISINENFFNSIVNGKRNTSPRTAKKIAQNLNVEINEIFKYTSDKKEEYAKK